MSQSSNRPVDNKSHTEDLSIACMASFIPVTKQAVMGGEPLSAGSGPGDQRAQVPVSAGHRGRRAR